MDYSSITQLGVPVLAVLIAGGLVWATTQVIKAAVNAQKTRYLLYSLLGSLVVAILVTLTMNPLWSWKSFAWVAYGGWLASNLLHKLYAKFLQSWVEKKANGAPA